MPGHNPLANNNQEPNNAQLFNVLAQAQQQAAEKAKWVFNKIFVNFQISACVKDSWVLTGNTLAPSTMFSECSNSAYQPRPFSESSKVQGSRQICSAWDSQFWNLSATTQLQRPTSWRIRCLRFKEGGVGVKEISFRQNKSRLTSSFRFASERSWLFFCGVCKRAMIVLDISLDEQLLATVDYSFEIRLIMRLGVSSRKINRR